MDALATNSSCTFMIKFYFTHQKTHDTENTYTLCATMEIN